MSLSSSDLLINGDGTIYHLGLKPCDIPDNIITVGDMARVDMIGEMLDEITISTQNREYRTICGTYNSKKIMIISSGIGGGAAEILINELDALVNIDFENRVPKKEIRSLNIIRIGTTGAISPQLKLADAVISQYTIGIDGLAHFYKEAEYIDQRDLSQKFHKEVFDSSALFTPYSVECSSELLECFEDFSLPGITMCAGGFFAPQGRTVRLHPRYKDMIERIADFRYNSLELTNIEMEGAIISTLAQILGHKSITICLVVAHRLEQAANVDYQDAMRKLARNVLIGISKN